MTKTFFNSIKMLKFGETKVAKEKIYGAKKPIKIWDVNVGDIVFAKLVQTKKMFYIRLDI